MMVAGTTLKAASKEYSFFLLDYLVVVAVGVTMRMNQIFCVPDDIIFRRTTISFNSFSGLLERERFFYFII
jgi:hypothetical protein